MLRDPHEQFEGLCLAAAHGEIDQAGWDTLTAHLAYCDRCRRLLGNTATIFVDYLPTLSQFPLPQKPEEALLLHDSIMRAVSREGAQFSSEIRPPISSKRDSAHERQRKRAIGLWAIAATVLACCIAAAGLWLGHTRVPHDHTENLVAKDERRQESILTHPDNKRSDLLKQEVAALQSEQSRLKSALKSQQQSSSRFQDQGTAAKQEIDSLQMQLAQARESATKAEQSVDRLNQEREASEAAIAKQNEEIVSLNNRLQENSANKDRENDVVAAEHKLNELVWARNLHVVDVYDIDPNGGTKKAVGRVFFTEGKSLVFYAYDLATENRASKKYGYYVWAYKGGDETSLRNLGSLDPDDSSRERWTLQVADAAALAKIDQVFVTLEPLNKLGSRPHGKRFLNAFLGPPANHP